MRQHGEYRFARRTLDPPDGDPIRPAPDIMGVAGETTPTVTQSLVGDWTAQGEKKGQHTFDKGLAIAQELKVGRFVVSINGDGAVVPCPFARLSHVSLLW